MTEETTTPTTPAAAADPTPEGETTPTPASGLTAEQNAEVSQLLAGVDHVTEPAEPAPEGDGAPTEPENGTEAAPAAEGDPEATPATETPPEPQEPTRAADFAALAKSDRDLREARQQIEDLKGQSKVLDDAQKLAQDNPLEFAKKFGIQPAKLVEQFLNDEETPKSAVQGDVEALRAELETMKTNQAEREKTAQEAEYNQKYRTHLETVKNFVDTGEGLELCREYMGDNPGLPAEIVAVQTLWHKQHGKALTVAEAASKVESTLLDMTVKMAGLDKVKAKFPSQPGATPAPPAAQTAGEKTDSITATDPEPKTLSNQQQTAPSESKPLSDEEAVERAAQSIKYR